MQLPTEPHLSEIQLHDLVAGKRGYDVFSLFFSVPFHVHAFSVYVSVKSAVSVPMCHEPMRD